MEEFLIYIENNIDTAIEIYNQHYFETALYEGEQMLMDPSYCESGDDVIPEDLYEEYAHIMGHKATWSGAMGVIEEMGDMFDVESRNEDIQWEVLLILGKEPI